MPALPGTITLTQPADNSLAPAADQRNDHTAIQNAVNAIIGWGNGLSGSTTYRKTTAKTVNTTTAATDLLNGEVTIAAGAMGATGVLRIKASGDHLQNSGGNAAQPRFQLVFGGVTVFDTGVTAAAEAAGATRWPWSVEATISNLTAATQNAWIRVQTVLDPNSGVSNLFTTGNGGWQEGANVSTWTNAFGFGVNTGLTVATGSAAALVLNVINGSANAAYETKLFDALVEII